MTSLWHESIFVPCYGTGPRFWLSENRNVAEAVNAIFERRPDLVFLDIQMPDMDGFGVIEAVGPHEMPAVVFVTAHDAHALAAFEVNALDYLLKPFADERFDIALEKAFRFLASPRLGELSDDWTRLLETYRRAGGNPQQPDLSVAGRYWPRRLPVPGRNRVFFVNVVDIDWIQAEGPYVSLHCGQKKYHLRDSLKRLETVLNPDHFDSNPPFCHG